MQIIIYEKRRKETPGAKKYTCSQNEQKKCKKMSEDMNQSQKLLKTNENKKRTFSKGLIPKPFQSNRNYQIQMFKPLFIFVFLFWTTTQLDLDFPGVPITPSVIQQARRAHRYMAKTLDEYQYRQTSKYTLYLAIENYEEKLYQLKQYILAGLSNYIAGSKNLVLGKGNIILGSNSKLAGYNNWILTEREVTSKEVEQNVLYFGKWRILLDKIPIIEYRPDLAIENLDSEDELILRNLKGVRDLRKFHQRKRDRQLRKF